MPTPFFYLFNSAEVSKEDNFSRERRKSINHYFFLNNTIILKYVK